MSQEKPPQHKPVTLEKRKNLLYSSNKRRSIRNIIALSLLALAIGLAIAYLLRGIVEIEVSTPQRQDHPDAAPAMDATLRLLPNVVV
jgi:hypothetical protein